MRTRRLEIAPWALLLGTFVHGCAYVSSKTTLAPIAPLPAPAHQPRIEQTVGDFAFSLEGGKMVTSSYQGAQLNKGILDSWKDRGYISEATFVEDGAFTGGADYDLTLSGSQYGESSIVLQILCGLTLFLIPYSVTQHYDLQYTVKDTKSGTLYNAGVQDTETAYVELFLLFTLPWAIRNHAANLGLMGDHLYDQLHRQGAFHAPAVRAP